MIENRSYAILKIGFTAWYRGRWHRDPRLNDGDIVYVLNEHPFHKGWYYYSAEEKGIFLSTVSVEYLTPVKVQE